jgi:hypothetical protein
VNLRPELAIALTTVLSSIGLIAPAHAGQPITQSRNAIQMVAILTSLPFGLCDLITQYLSQATGEKRWKEMRMTASVRKQKIVFSDSLIAGTGHPWTA